MMQKELNRVRNTISRLIANIPALVKRGHWDQDTAAAIINQYRLHRHNINRFGEQCMELGRLTRIAGELYKRAIKGR